jgi:uncharacterized protein DUF3750
MTSPWTGSLLLLLVTACLGPSPGRLIRSEDYMVVVSSVRLPADMVWYTRFAEHTWIDLKAGDESSWTRLEVTGESSGVEVSGIDSEEAREVLRWGNRVAVLETLTGGRAQRAIARLLALAAAEPDFGRVEQVLVGKNHWMVTKHPPEERDYVAWPGPNSNSFVAALIDGTPELHVELHHNAVGKDYPRGFRAGLTSGGYGLELDSGFLGAGLGLRQGLELHLAQLTVGVSLWPPALKLPFLPRIGVHQGWVGAAGSFEDPAQATQRGDEPSAAPPPVR